MVRYVRADSQSLISGLKSTLEAANNVTNKLEQGSKHLINTVERKELSGADYTAGKGLFQKFIVSTIKRADSAIEVLKDDLARYQNADYEVNR